MSLTYLPLIAALDLIGILFNIRMLCRCFKNATKYTFLQKCRTLTIGSCACQVTILVTDAVESWKGSDRQPIESSKVLRMLPISTMFFLACTISMLYSEHRTAPKNRGRSSKLEMAVGLCLGLVGSATMLLGCFYEEFLFQMIIRGIVFAVFMAIALLGITAAFRDSVQQENTIQEDSKKTCSLLWKVCKQNKALLLFYCISCLMLLLSDLSSSLFEQTNVFNEIFNSLAKRLIVGIILPEIFIFSIDSSYEEEDEAKTVAI